ncbi:metallophosphoesterase [Enterococcus columbae]|uniref:Phosphoesterase n=1 Tax=Enterococcus columbae DSM 7374 = ATCC 51263 TaxID=1121865 RepID=S1NUM1_9ENTE|nr:metallophosphoesterase [Enterococcus columbae]EOT44456.1 hypothetical protein OMW_00512 [Enterococcus columbae DSM 7374 = ATCC 51263]EOW84614.1 hypothetical protein I568_01110 [Enterococcus columbae DSM 7374 = ATCC 51263]OJG21453.1 hypothetical protein RR47_GL001400 [Enterococcus columbae DSM 7374 = ATCC 51263]
MKYLVMSDSHGDREIVYQVAEHFKDNVDYIIHCGDSELPSDEKVWQEITVVTGNCDYDSGYREVQIIHTPLDCIYVTHGHLSGVRMGITKLGLQAQEAQVDIVLFGHTHEIGCEKVGQRLFLNPGSISYPRGALNYQSFAIIESTEDSWHIQYYTRDFQPITALAFTFSK